MMEEIERKEPIFPLPMSGQEDARLMDQISSDVLTPGLAARYAATFDREWNQTGRQGIHWCLNLPFTATEALGVDGHPARVDHADLPRRMWAASTIEFHAPIPVGATVERVSRIVDSNEKSGKSGRLLFVTVVHNIRADEVLAVTEQQSIVYREPLTSGAPVTLPPSIVVEEKWDWERLVTPNPPLLFRYSALTFNSHRIHYDIPYAKRVEKYPELVIQGPLMASLLLDLADRELGPDAFARFAFRAVSPAFAGRPLRLLGRREGAQVTLAVAGTDGVLHVSASGLLVGHKWSGTTDLTTTTPQQHQPGAK